MIQSFYNSFHNFLVKNFSLDLRALAIMRMAVASVVMLDLLIRSSSLVAFYTDEGLLPLSILYKSNWNPSFFSIYVMSTGWKFIALLFVVNFLLALCLFFGYRTQLMTFLCWLFMISLHNRNPIILQGGDELLRLMLFWGIFLPWGNRYSIDNIRQPKDSESFFGISVLGYIFLIFSLYFFSALLKTSPEWRSEGSALYYVFNIDQMTWPLGKWLLQFPGLLKLLTHLTFYLELLVPFLLFIPYKTNFFRLVFIFLIGTFHLVIGSTLYVGLFFIIGLITLLALIPVGLMDEIEKRLGRFIRYVKKIFLWINKILPQKNNYDVKSVLFRSELLNFQIKLFKNAILFFIICFNMLWCISNLESAPIKVNEKFHWFAYLFRFDQDWGMFAPSVYKDDGWYIYEAELENKSSQIEKIDLNRNGLIVDYTKPAKILDLYQDDRWRKFGEMWPRQSDRVKKEFCRYLKNKWNSENADKRIAALRIVFMKEFTKPNYAYVTPEKTVVCDCEKW